MSNENTSKQQIDLTHDEAVTMAAAEQAHLSKKRVRQTIAETAGDDASLLGTTADAAALAIYGLASLSAKLATAKSIQEVNAAASELAALSQGFLAKIQSGEIKLPCMVKGIDNVIADIETRSTAVSNALIEAQKTTNKGAKT